MVAGRAPFVALCVCLVASASCSPAEPPPPRPPRDGGADGAPRDDGATPPGDAAADAIAEPPDAGIAPCDDPGPEPNDTEEDATPITPEPSHCDDRTTISGMLAGPGDADWSRVQGVDVCGDGLSTTLDEREIPAGVRACVFVSCAIADAPRVTCTAGTRATSPSGLSGCCRTGASVALDVVCRTGASQLVYWYVRLDQTAAAPGTCSTYRAVLGRL